MPAFSPLFDLTEKTALSLVEGYGSRSADGCRACGAITRRLRGSSGAPIRFGRSRLRAFL
jgi:hypothetical protein